MFDTVTLATLLADADDVLTIVAVPITLMLAFWGARRVARIIKSFVG